MSFTCQWCKNVFSRLSILYKHQRTAQYCLKLQNKSQTVYKCRYCDNEYTRRDNLFRHEKRCYLRPLDNNQPETTNVQTGQLLEMIVQLQKTITNISERPVETTNVNTTRNVTMNLAPITDQDIQDHLDHLTIDFIQEGGRGYASWANSYPFKDRILCTDKSRKRLKYKDNAGALIDDGGGLKLATRFFQAISNRNTEIINEEYRDLHARVEEIAREGSSHRKDLTSLLTKASRLQELLIKCNEAARGEENELTKEFIHHLSKLL